MQKFLIAAGICCFASAASAELTYGTAFAKFHTLDAGGPTDLDVRTYGAGLEYRTTNLTFSAEIGRINSEDLDFDFGSAGLGYAVSDQATIGLDYARFDVLGEDAKVTSIYGMYHGAQFTLGISAGDSSDLTETTYSVFGAYDVSPTGTVGLDIIRFEDETILAGYADYELESYDIQADLVSLEDFDLVAVAGAYNVSPSFALIGSLSRFDLLGVDGTAITLGGQYEFARGMNAEVAVGRISVDGAPNIDQVTFGLNYETGRRTSKRRTLANIFSSATGSFIGLTDF